jgi:8-oxo-dGTP pyrophosphatase MutT (NUDIX family)
MPVPQVFSAGFLIFRKYPDRQQFLLMQHVDRWDLPKGHLDENENDLDAAFRELVEETGITHDHIWMDPNFKYQNEYEVVKKTGKRRWKRLTIFLAYLRSPVTIQPTEHVGYKWFDWQPGMQIQPLSIDPLLESVADYLAEPPDQRLDGPNYHKDR